MSRPIVSTLLRITWSLRLVSLIEAISLLLEDHPRIPVDGPERRPEVMGYGIAEALQFLVDLLQLRCMLRQGSFGKLAVRNIEKY